jgi:hypothetical protein
MILLNPFEVCPPLPAASKPAPRGYLSHPQQVPILPELGQSHPRHPRLGVPAALYKTNVAFPCLSKATRITAASRWAYRQLFLPPFFASRPSSCAL